MTVTLDDFLKAPQAAQPSQAQEQKRIGPWELRPYQVEAIYAWRREGYRGIVIAPTGTGKTVIAIAAIRETAGRTLVVVPTERILKTWLSALRRAGLRAGTFYGRVKDPDIITITIYNSVLRHPEILRDVELVVFDEIHHAGAEKFSQILSQVKDDQRVLGLTATLRRQDGRDNEIRSKLKVVYYLSPRDALEGGYLAPVRIIPVPAPLSWLDRQRYQVIERQINETKAALRAARALDDEQKVQNLDTKLKILYNRRRQILANIESKKNKVLEIVRRHQDEDRIIVFSESISSIEELKIYLQSHGVAAETYHSGKTEQERDIIFSEWGRSFKVLLAVRALDEGIDVPEVKVGIVVASGMSWRQLVQRKGRLVRPVPGKTAHIYVVYAESTIEYEIFLRMKAIIAGRVRLY